MLKRKERQHRPEAVFSGLLASRPSGRKMKAAFQCGPVLDIAPLLSRPIRFPFHGETRKIILARALMKSPRLLILDEPFEVWTKKTRPFDPSINGLMTGLCGDPGSPPPGGDRSQHYPCAPG